ncbi:MAG: pyridoxal-phosphate dependent enzyme, partial [Gammaproteobacteria bacterium]|nr:pyridoxal-phosphate dependent enzyme [Gammaproteobacteria bacterium]
GNAGTSCAGFAASVGINSHIFVPHNTPLAKLAQLLLYSANIFAIEGSYHDAFNLCQEACDSFGWYNRNTGFNPFTIEGKKTVALEICEQLGWHAPDIIIVPVGDGCIISGVWRGICDLHNLGFIDKRPRLIAVQAEGSQAIKQALDSDGIVRSGSVNTVADSIAVSNPSNGKMAVDSIRASGGYSIAVSDKEMLDAVQEMGRLTGTMAEPAAAAPLAALKMMIRKGKNIKDKKVVLLITGSGLKDTESAIKAGGEPIRIKPALEEVEKALSARGAK